MIHVGDKVKIGYTGVVYNTYPGFLDYYRDIGCSAMIERVCFQYEYGRSPTDAEAHDKVFTVMFTREHGSFEGRILAVINDGSVTYIIDINALTLVSSDLPFAEGDKVFISDQMRVYSTWDNLVKHMSTVIPDGEEVYRKWANGHSPATEPSEAVFTVKWIGRHISRPDEDILAIVSSNTNTYIMSVKGLSGTGETSWDKYIIYVRNWAVVNKEAAQSVRDATGPKPYAEWLSDRK